MTVGKTMRAWLRAAQTTITLGIIAACVTPATAQVVDKLQRVGRLQGFGWGDGYHTCGPSGIRLGADLPPKSPYARRVSHFKGSIPRLGHRGGATFYDRFDAANGRACDCGANCDSACCDGIPISALQSSQVTLGPDGIVSAEDPSTPVERPLDMTVASQSTQFRPQTDVRRPIRPEPPETIRTRSISIPVASHRADFGFPLPESTEESQPKSSSIARTTTSPTPTNIEPVHPYDLAAALPDESSLSKETDVQPKLPAESSPVTGIPSYALEMPTSSANPSISPEVVINPEVVEAPQPPTFAAQKPSPRRITPPVAESSAAPSPKPEEIAAPTPTTNRIAAEPTAPTPYVLPPRVAVKRPARIGMTPANAPGTVSSDSIAPRPSRIGFSRDVKVNPFASRPVVELAERTSSSSEGVVYQPGGGSLK